jgi:hypothetical protein
VANGKIFNQQASIILFGHLWVVELTCWKNFPSSSLSGVSSLLLFPFLATGLNLLLVLLIPVAIFAPGVIDTCGIFSPESMTPAVQVEKITTGVIDTSGAPRLANISVNFWKNLQ